MRELHNLANHFEELAVPAHGSYVGDPALVNGKGVQYIPPAQAYGLVLKLVGLTAASVVGFLRKKYTKKKKTILYFAYN